MTGAPSESSARVVKLIRPLPDLHHRPFNIVLVTLIGTLSLVRFLGPRAIPDEMVCTPAIETEIIAASLWILLHI
jgi:hypothetical protein